MPLGPDDMESAQRDDLVVLGIGQGLEVRMNAVVPGLLDAVEAIEMVEIDKLLVVDETGLALGETLGDLL